MSANEMELRIDWSDLDLFGHVNNVAFFRYIQASRVHFCEHVGLTSVNEAGKPGFIVASISCQFRKPLHYPGKIKVVASVGEIGHTSFELHHTIVDEQDVIVAHGTDVLVVFDYGKSEKIPIGNALRDLLLVSSGKTAHP